MGEFLGERIQCDDSGENPYTDNTHPVEQERSFPHLGGLLHMPLDRLDLVGPTLDTSRPRDDLASGEDSELVGD